MPGIKENWYFIHVSLVICRFCFWLVAMILNYWIETIISPLFHPWIPLKWHWTAGKVHPKGCIPSSLPPSGRHCSSWRRPRVPSLVWSSLQKVSHTTHSSQPPETAGRLSSALCGAPPGTPRLSENRELSQLQLSCHSHPGCSWVLPMSGLPASSA